MKYPNALSFDIIILGGGLAGASLAAALRHSNRCIALIEPRPPTPPTSDDRWDLRVYAISPGSHRFLNSLELSHAMDPDRVAPVYDMRVCGDAGGEIHFSAYECGVDALSHIIESDRLSYALWESLARQANLQIFSPAQAASLNLGPAPDTGRATVHLIDGTTLQGRLIIGADGRESWTRNAAQLPAKIHPYDELGVVAHFACQHPHRGTAWQWFREDGVLAWLPMPGRAFSMVWSAPLPEAEALLALSPEALAEKVAEAGAHQLGKLTPLSPAVGFPLKLMTVPQTIAPRLALIGDAAHGIHPLSGHGINLGFSDAAELARQILAARDTTDIGDLRFLQTYAKARRTETLLLQQGTHALHQLFRNEWPTIPGLPFLQQIPVPPGLGLLRNFGLNLTNRISPVKSLLARIAMG